MPPKKTGTGAATKKATGSVPAHPSYQEMVSDAIRNLKDRTGSSRQAIKKYIQANNNLGSTTDAAFNTHINRALTNGEKSGVFSRPKGPSGPVKLAKPAAKPAAAKPAAKAKSTTTKKAAGTKKAAPKKTTTAKKAAPKKTETKTKANASKPRKTAAPAPAVDSKPAVALGKTKSGRVTKGKPTGGIKKAAPKKPAAKKATPKKAAAPKKDS